ncbi:DUF3253 domain-containing protein [Arthrobacter sp. 260]|uniref:DUF3253 domain-containing protein n=1 Tax=Arthrobacter sp. 260 TaxID=2735314 RepID=UPI0014911C52|nr:DUF3253 domain-containing protein [Arthrobacter sp. 260]NOJ60532.1 DUF2256 and DUF3253 domain-containing protein [Arthrobacter sp. 260]
MAHRQRGTARTPNDKTCVSCGRRIQWRAKWASTWAEVRYCSADCRRRGVTRVDRELEARILTLLTAGSSIGSADAAHAVGGADWRDLIEPARRAARRLVTTGQVQIVQNGSVVDPSTAKGLFRIRRTL